jgi:hypothetical protein
VLGYHLAGDHTESAEARKRDAPLGQGSAAGKLRLDIYDYM